MKNLSPLKYDLGHVWVRYEISRREMWDVRFRQEKLRVFKPTFKNGQLYLELHTLSICNFEFWTLNFEPLIEHSKPYSSFYSLHLGDDLFIISFVNIRDHVTNGFIGFKILSYNITIMLGEDVVDASNDPGTIMMNMDKPVRVLQDWQL